MFDLYQDFTEDHRKFITAYDAMGRQYRDKVVEAALMLTGSPTSIKVEIASKKMGDSLADTMAFYFLLGVKYAESSNQGSET